MSPRDEARERKLNEVIDDPDFACLGPKDVRYLRDQLREARAALFWICRAFEPETSSRVASVDEVLEKIKDLRAAVREARAERGQLQEDETWSAEEHHRAIAAIQSSESMPPNSFPSFQERVWWRAFKEELETVTRERNDLRQAQQWQPIETAPKDGTRVQLWWPHWRSYPVTGRYLCGSWDSSARLEGEHDPGPTHWMPLPEAPR